MTPAVTVREAQLPGDYETMAALISAEREGWPITAAELETEDAARDPRFFRVTLLAELDGVPAGVGTAGHIPYAHREGRFGLDLRVVPARQGQGAGKALYAALLERLAPHHPRELITEVWEGLARPERFFSERGFQPTWRRIDSTLDTASFDPAPFAPSLQRLAAAGIEIVTYAALSEDPERARRLHTLDWALLQDMPFGEPLTQVSLQQFIGETLNAPAFLPEACFIAVKDGAWIGYSNLLKGDGYYATQMTGVLPAWREHGVATALKLAGIDYAKRHGNFEIRTTNDAVNAPMIRINQRLGFKEEGALVRWKAVNGAWARS